MLKITGVVLMLFGLTSFENLKTEKINIMAIMHPKKGQEKALIMTLQALVKPTHSEEGCIAYNVHQSKDGTVFLYEVWRSQEDFEKHLKMPYIIDFVSKINDFIEGENDVHFGKLIAPEKDVSQSLIDLDNTETIYVSSIKVPQNSKSKKLKKELEKLVKPTQNEQGCLAYNLYEEKDGSLFLYEAWRSQEDVDQHFEKDYVKDFRKKVADLAKRNEVHFGKIIE